MQNDFFAFFTQGLSSVMFEIPLLWDDPNSLKSILMTIYFSVQNHVVGICFQNLINIPRVEIFLSCTQPSQLKKIIKTVSQVFPTLKGNDKWNHQVYRKYTWLPFFYRTNMTDYSAEILFGWNLEFLQSLE